MTGRTCQSKSTRRRTRRSHHEVTPPIAYGYVPSVVSRIRVRFGRGALPPTGARSLRSRRTEGLLAGALALFGAQVEEPRADQVHRPVELLADLEQRLAHDGHLGQHLRRLVRRVLGVLGVLVAGRQRPHPADHVAEARELVARRLQPRVLLAEEHELRVYLLHRVAGGGAAVVSPGGGAGAPRFPPPRGPGGGPRGGGPPGAGPAAGAGGARRSARCPGGTRRTARRAQWLRSRPCLPHPRTTVNVMVRGAV